MLKKFFMNLLSSFMGAWIALVLFGVVAVMVIVAMVARVGASGGEVPSVKKHSVMVIDLKGSIIENDVPMDFDPLDYIQGGDLEKPTTLVSLIAGIREGARNKDIDALYLKCGGVSAGLTTLQSLRGELEAFRKSGKKIYAYSDSYTQGDYYVASVADSIFLNAGGTVNLHGLGGTALYFKDLFDKLGVTFQVFKVGTFKSAVEPYILNKMSEPARAQLDTLYTNLWTEVVSAIAKSRKLKPENVSRIASTGFAFAQDASWAVKSRLADKIVYQREMDDIIGRIVDKKGKDVNYVDVAMLAQKADWGTDYNSKKQIAVLFASGEIAESEKAGIYCEKLVPEIVKLAEDDNVKGLVMRVNSPGGSVFGSEQIAEALQYFKSKGKPFAVSMGDYAASGGYWISADADRIFAMPSTITGSIGIFGLVPDLSGLASKLGVSPQLVYTDPEGNFPDPIVPMTEAQKAAMQKSIEHGYDRFVARVAKGRKIKEARVRQIAEGRVWDGKTALKLGLVDRLGTLDDAIEWVAGKCGIKGNHGVALYPAYEPSMWDLFSSAAAGEVKALADDLSIGREEAAMLRRGLNILQRNPVQARMITIKVTL